MAVQSAVFGPTKLIAGEKNTITGFAYSGGGRGIVRVDVSVDDGKNSSLIFPPSISTDTPLLDRLQT